MANNPNDDRINAAIASASPLDDDDFDGRESRDEGGGLPNSFGYSVDKLNQEWALVLIGSKAAIIREKPDAPVEDRIRILTTQAFGTWMANRPTEVRAADGKIKRVSWATRWISDRGRRTYDGIEFFPNPDGAANTSGYLNLWQGYSTAPDAGAGSYGVFRDHMLTNFCSGDERLFEWVFAWFAQMVQRPREKMGTAIVIRGKQGAGKTTVGDVMGSLFEAHYFLVDEPRYVTGNFNAHMASCLLLQAEEAVWAGDKVAEGKLKGLITAKTQMIESKGIDPFRLTSYNRIMMTSNEDWVVPAGKDERRYCVLDIAPNAVESFEYFDEMYEELNNGGREALLADLLAFDLSKVNLRLAPKTKSLLEQKIRSFNPIESFLFLRLYEGYLSSKISGWPPDGEIKKEALFNQYLDESDRIGIKRRQDQTAFGIGLKRLIPAVRTNLKRIDTETNTRKGFYGFPSLQACRDAFEAALGQPVDWPDDDEPWLKEEGEDADF